MIQQGCSTTRDADDLLIVSLMRPLRRVWKTTALLCAVLCCALGCLFWHTQTPVYESRATISLQPFKSSVLSRTQDAAKVGVFEPFINTQAVALKSHDTIERILEHYRQSGITIDGLPKTITSQKILDGLWVEHPPESLLLHLHYRDSNHQTAKAIVDLIANGYTAIYEQTLDAIDDGRLVRLTERHLDLSALRNAYEAELLTLVQGNDVDALSRSQDVYARLASSVERELIRLQASLTVARVANGENNASQTSPASQAIDLEKLGPPLTQSRDTLLDQYLIQLAKAQSELTSVERRFGQAHQSTKHLDSRIGELSELITSRLQLHSTGDNSSTGPDGLSGPLPWSLRAKVYEEQVALYQDTHERIKQSLGSIEETLVQARTAKERSQQLRADIQRTNQDLETIDRRIASIRIEQGFDSMARVVRLGSATGPPASDPRKSLALSGLMLGLFIGIGGMLAWVWIDPRCHHPDQLAKSANPMPNTAWIQSTDDVQTAATLHRCRHTLTQTSDPAGAPVIAVTSGAAKRCAGDLASALAVSAANAGLNTLLIDLETDQHQASQLIGAMAISSPDASVQALARIEQTQALAEKLEAQLDAPIDSSTKSNLKPTPELQSSLQALLEGGSLSKAISQTGTANLSVVYNDDPHFGLQEHTINQTHLENLLSEAKKTYDLVLVPISNPQASLLATIAWSQSDQRLLHVRRGDNMQWISRLANTTGSKLSTGFLFETQANDLFSAVTQTRHPLKKQTTQNSQPIARPTPKHEASP